MISNHFSCNSPERNQKQKKKQLCTFGFTKLHHMKLNNIVHRGIEISIMLLLDSSVSLQVHMEKEPRQGFLVSCLCL